MVTEITVEQMHAATQEQLDAWSEWARANGLDARQISAQYPVRVLDGVIHYRAMAKATADGVEYAECTAPLIVSMPEG
jgi:predicted HicB family RNase H-like nuclease